MSSTFLPEIDAAFGAYTNDEIINCSKDKFVEIITELFDKVGHYKQSNTINTKKRKPANFMNWLNSGFRQQIKEEYFGDYDSWEDWSEDGIRNYYSKKELPLAKLESLFEKKRNEGKKVTKPRLMSLITIKAGIIWSEMTLEEKSKFEVVDFVPEENTNTSETLVTKKKSKTKAGTSGLEAQVKKALEEATTNEDEDSVSVEEFIYEGISYFRDEENNVYNQEHTIVGKYISDDNVEFS